ncbi:hypothetical protein B0H66DRAFT_606411 [Apodospora peruviana]|uniref:Uncharacterized protein n=1 Tax=Apodospora peruviana TaxID=516989 RepID=A0AAE0HZT8_9PEZI|nr:hypothetical protein B0H66DRAFT_606411 [Apodospora peruviana]
MADKTTSKLTDSAAPIETKKKSLYQRYQDAKHGRNRQISDDEMLKYTGKTKAGINEWGKNTPGVAGNQAAGKLAMGPASGFGGFEAAQGYGGWGPDAAGTLKFPPNGAGAATAKYNAEVLEEAEDAEGAKLEALMSKYLDYGITVEFKGKVMVAEQFPEVKKQLEEKRNLKAKKPPRAKVAKPEASFSPMGSCL